MPPHQSFKRILLLAQDAEVRASLLAMLEEHYEVRPFADVAEARGALEQSGSFPLVIADLVLPAGPELDFLAEVHERWPETVRVVLTEDAAVDHAVGLTDPSIYRFVWRSCTPARLSLVVEGAFAVYESRVREECCADELQFNYESLADFNAALEERLTQQTVTLRRLHQFALDLNRAESTRGLVELAAEVSNELLGGRGVHVQVWDPEHVTVEAFRGPEMSAQLHCVQLNTIDGPVGEIVVDKTSMEGESFTERHREMLDSIASSTAVAVHNELRRRERDHAQHATILAMARLSEQRDNETGHHLERVSSYCKLVAEGLREDGLFTDVIDETWIQDLVRSAPLHDIGKVGIPDSILLKPGKLTPEEWVIMKTHTVIGGATLDSVIQQERSQGFLHMGRDIALGHHERWDGSGYPAGLEGDAIPLVARIVALADVYDALTTVRPYKAAWTHHEGLAWIIEGRGTHFDPRIVDAFVRREALADEIRSRLADGDDDLRRSEYARSA